MTIKSNAQRVMASAILAGAWTSVVPSPLARAGDAPATENRETVEDLHGGFGAAIPLPPDAPPIASGPFEPTYESLRAYKCPQWYADAKFGMWAHWGPQGVAEIGDWYARGLYEEGSGVYKYHLAHYGHPSKFGYKDIIQLWKAEKFDPDHLISLYKAAGAKYFVSMACHHDNFDLWNSKYHRWNAVNMGPRKDIVGLWRDAAVKQGLRFGISEHMAPSFKWFSVAHNADKTGPMAGVPYDGNDPAFYDLYGPKPEKIWSSGAELWAESGMPDSWKMEWYLRCRDAVDTYKPDYIYSDYGNVPFRREVGWKLLADYYNDSIRNHGGKLEAVYTGKGDRERVYVRDFESGGAGEIQPEPWQMDWCINSFFYFKDTKERPYRTADTVIRLLCHVVSKNGNLLLSVPQRPDGTIDDEEEKILADLASWMSVNGEAIFGTRPFKVYGEGPAVVTNFRVKKLPFSAADVRFTTKGDVLYASVLGNPEGRFVVKTLGTGCTLAGGRITGVSVVGYDGKLNWDVNDDGLVVQVPEDARLSPIANVLKITGLTDIQWDGDIYPARNGEVVLSAGAAHLHGDKFALSSDSGPPQIRQWMKAADYLSWPMKIRTPGKYEVRIRYSSVAATAVSFDGGDHALAADLPATAGWDDTKTASIGTIDIPAQDGVEIKLRPQDAATWRPINLTDVMLIPVK